MHSQISKSNVVDDMVASNSILYKPNEKPDHCVVIKYVPYVGKYLQMFQLFDWILNKKYLTYFLNLDHFFR